MEIDVHERLLRSKWTNVLRRYFTVLAVYLLVTLSTGAHFMADTADYVNSVVAYDAGRHTDFWEFGHLFWRPLGWLLFATFKPLAKMLIGDDPRGNVIFVFLAVNWLAGLLSVCAMHGICGKVCERRWAINFTTIVFIFSQGFLNFTQTGCSYIPGLSLLLLGLYFLATGNEHTKRTLQTTVMAGFALAGAVCMWFPYVLAVPAALASPVFLSSFDRRTFRLVIATGSVVAFFLGLSYIMVAVGVLGIATFGGFRTWMSAASHETDIRGVTRMVFGFARSFIYMGNDGIVFKRYLVKDPFNPVTLPDLFRLSLWKLSLFYGFIAAVCGNLLRSAQGRRILSLLALNGIPVISFAVFFDGGAIERYLPLYPLIFVSLAVSLCNAQSLQALKYIAMTFGIAVMLANASAMAKPVLQRQQQATVARISDPQRQIKPQSLILTLSWQDELINFSRSFPFHPINRLGYFRIGALVTPGTTYVSEWRKGFAAQALETWQNGGDLWVSRRVLSPRPRAEWNWVEGDERRVSWPDFYAFFSQLDSGETVGGDDGFILILPSPKNLQFLKQLLDEKQS